MRGRFWIVAVLVVGLVALLTACARAPGAKGDGGTARRSPEVFFPQTREALDAYPTAMMGGKLVLDDRGCLRLRPGDWVPVWPADLRLETGGDGTRVVNANGRVVAEVGREVFMGGGQVGLPKGVVDPRTARELRSRCSEDPGDYWIADTPSMSKPTPVGIPRTASPSPD
jgi:hypothetical protein